MQFENTDRDLALEIFNSMDKDRNGVLSDEEFLGFFDQLDAMINTKIRRESQKLDEVERQIANCKENIQNLIDESKMNPSNQELRERSLLGSVSIICKTNPQFEGSLEFTYGANRRKALEFTRGEAKEEKYASLSRFLIEEEEMQIVFKGATDTAVLLKDLPLNNDYIFELQNKQNFKIRVYMKRKITERYKFERNKTQLNNTAAGHRTKIEEFEKQLDSLYNKDQVGNRA